MNDPFTMAEFIEANKLDVSIHDAGATRLIVAHLISKGYRKYRTRQNGKMVTLWTKKINGKESLAEKLKKIK